MSKIVYTDADGNVCIVSAANDDVALDILAKDIVPDSVEFEILGDDDLPPDDFYRRENGEWVVDQNKAKDVIREMRVPLLIEADYLVNAAQDKGDAAAEATARAYRQSLRDITSAYDNPVDVVWPAVPNGKDGDS